MTSHGLAIAAEGTMGPRALAYDGATFRFIADYNLPTDSMNNADLKRLDELSRDKRYQEIQWQKHIASFRQLQRKAEQQAFSKYGMDFVVDEYLPDKLT